MTEKDLDTAIEKCERIMEFDTRTLKNPDSENGYIFEKVYDLLKFLRQFEFETGGMDDTISRRAAIDTAIEAVDDWDGGTNIGRQKRIEKAIKALPPVQSEPKSYRMGFQAGYAAAQRWIPCSERMPFVDEYGKSDQVLATCGLQGAEASSIRWLRILYFNGCNWCFPTGESYEQMVYAWTPLPTPYREGGQDE